MMRRQTVSTESGARAIVNKEKRAGVNDARPLFICKREFGLLSMKFFIFASEITNDV